MDHHIWVQGEVSMANKQNRILTPPPVAREIQVRATRVAGLPVKQGLNEDAIIKRTNDKQVLITMGKKGCLTCSW